jgi:hypothetical protein
MGGISESRMGWICTGLGLQQLLLPRLERQREQTTAKWEDKIGRVGGGVYIPSQTHKGQRRGKETGSSWEDGAGWLDNLSPEDLFYVRPSAFHGRWDGGFIWRGCSVQYLYAEDDDPGGRISKH